MLIPTMGVHEEALCREEISLWNREQKKSGSTELVLDRETSVEVLSVLKKMEWTMQKWGQEFLKVASIFWNEALCWKRDRDRE